MTSDARNDYLDVLSKTLSFSYWEKPLKSIAHSARRGLAWRLAMGMDGILRPFGIGLAILPTEISWPALATCMSSITRLDNVRQLCESVVAENIPGSFIECGVWRGGVCIFARAVLPKDRTVYCCDSFCGLPYDKAEPWYSEWDYLKVSEDEVRANFEKFNLLQNVQFIKGWFADSLKNVPGPIAVLRADGDMHSSTLDILTALYPKVSRGGYVIIDDYCLEPCLRAVTEYREAMGVNDAIVPVDEGAVYWRKT
jgi:O-methyltransferase